MNCKKIIKYGLTRAKVPMGNESLKSSKIKTDRFSASGNFGKNLVNGIIANLLPADFKLM